MKSGQHEKSSATIHFQDHRSFQQPSNTQKKAQQLTVSCRYSLRKKYHGRTEPITHRRGRALATPSHDASGSSGQGLPVQGNRDVFRARGVKPGVDVKGM
jgi:hypothetical protein